jgi:hypothetical protein
MMRGGLAEGMNPWQWAVMLVPMMKAAFVDKTPDRQDLNAA